jgi:uncharacterized membrane protein
MGWVVFAAALAAFFILHSVPLRPPVRPWLVARLGPAGFGIAFSVLSIALLGAIFVAARHAPRVALWGDPPHAGWIVLAAMILAGTILAFGLGKPNPMSFGGTRNVAFDPANAGLLRWVRHPVLAAFLLWSAAHLVANGDLAHVLLFGSMAGFSLMGMAMIDRRRRREMGEAAWQETVAEMRAATLRPTPGAALRFALVLSAVAVLVLLHPWIAGVGVLRRFMP